MFVDFPGQTVPIYDSATQTVVLQAQIFVSVLGASNYIFAEALPSQQLVPWVNAHAHAFASYAGCPEVLVVDNLPSGVTKPHRYEPIVNESYLDLASHFGVAVAPARPYKPRDKAKIESGVLVVERWILARLRHRRFYSLGELNLELERLVRAANLKPFKKMAGCRQSVFEEVERPALRPLPARPYEFATFLRGRKVHIDYHVEVDYHYYSVPYQHTGERVDVRLTASTVEIFLRGRRIASHLRSYLRGRHTTDPAHRPESHRRHLEWPPERLVSWAEATGPQTAALVKGILEACPHPEHGYRSCLGIIRLGKRYGERRLEVACAVDSPVFEVLPEYSGHQLLRRLPGFEFTPMLLAKISSLIVLRPSGGRAVFAFMYPLLTREVRPTDADEFRSGHRSFDGHSTSDRRRPRYSRGRAEHRDPDTRACFFPCRTRPTYRPAVGVVSRPEQAASQPR